MQWLWPSLSQRWNSLSGTTDSELLSSRLTSRAHYLPSPYTVAFQRPQDCPQAAAGSRFHLVPKLLIQSICFCSVTSLQFVDKTQTHVLRISPWVFHQIPLVREVLKILVVLLVSGTPNSYCFFFFLFLFCVVWCWKLLQTSVTAGINSSSSTFIWKRDRRCGSTPIPKPAKRWRLCVIGASSNFPAR